MSGRPTRREFLAGAMSGVAGAALLPGCRETTTGPADTSGLRYSSGEPLPWINWAGNQVCRPSARLAPGSEDELASALRAATRPVRPVGAGHSFSPLVPSDGSLLATDLMSGLVGVDDERMRCEIWSGTRLHQLGPLMHARGHALPNLPDINYQTIAGATATATHGTGVDLGSLSSFIEGLAIVTPSGDLVECSREVDAELFHAARCSLGALGVLSRVTMKTRPAFQLVERSRFESLEDVLDDVLERAAQVPHFEFYALPHSSLAVVLETDEPKQGRVSTELGQDDEDAVSALREAYRSVGWLPFIGPVWYDRTIRSVAEDTPENVRSGPSHAVLAHHRLTRFREMEYTVPADAGPACLRQVLSTIRGRALPVVFPIECRYVKGDDVWLSMFEGRDGFSISVHQFADEDHRALFAEIEPIFWRYEGRPHWGKIHSLDAARLSQLYRRWRDFNVVREGVDPEGKMLNPHLRRVFGVEQGRLS